MRKIEIYNILNGLFYTFYGLWGLVWPERILKFFDVQAYGVYALHNIRALWAVCALLGMLMLWKARSKSAVMLCMIIACVTGAFAAGRLLGLAFDGMDAGSGVTYYEIGFELIWASIALLLIRLARRKPA